ncbi:MAG TPA: phage tail protein [Pyrinomonadaceae bacterium]|nr:phage tail protein [Pyrinomonadaceae bacterium]
MGLETLILIGVSFAISTASSLLLRPRPGQQGTQDNARAVDPKVQGSSYGAVIPRGYGTYETAGQVIWATDFKDTPTLVPGQKPSKRNPGTADQINHVYSRSFGILLGRVPPSGVQGIARIKFDDKVVYEGAVTGSNVISGKFHIMLGGATQTPNTWYEADKGVGNVSAHRDYITLWCQDIDLAPYGDRIPNVRAEVVQATEPSLQQVVEDECSLVGLTGSLIDADGLSGDTVDGYLVTSRAAVRSSLEQLREGFFFDASEYDARVNFFKRPQAPVITVPFGHIGFDEGEASLDDEEPEPAVRLKRKQGLEIAREVAVSYIAKSRDYEEGEQHYRRENFGGEIVLDVNLSGLVLSDDRALVIAKTHAVVGWNERVPADFTLPPDYMRYGAGAVFNFEVDEEGTLMEMRVERISLGAPGLVRVSCVEQLSSAYSQTATGAPGEVVPDPGGVEQISPTAVWMNDRPPFLDRDVGQAGYYITGRRSDPTKVWRGFVLLRDIDGAGDYRFVMQSTEAATMGEGTTVLAAGTGVDTTHTVDIQLDEESLTLSSITDDAFNDDQTTNLAAYGDETLQFRDALDLGGGLYRLSHIRREMRGTTGTGSTHAIGDRFVLITNAVKRVTINRDDVGKTFNFVALSFGEDLDDGEPFSYTYGGKGIEQGGGVASAPQDVEVLETGSSDILRWDAPAQNSATIDYYVVSVGTGLSGSNVTGALSGYDARQVRGNQFTLPLGAGFSTLYYSVHAHNAFGDGAKAAGSYDASYDFVASSVEVNQLSSAGDISTGAGKVLATGGLGVGNSATASTPGAVVKKMQVFDADGNPLGYVPIYDSIT